MFDPKVFAQAVTDEAARQNLAKGLADGKALLADASALLTDIEAFAARVSTIFKAG